MEDAFIALKASHLIYYCDNAVDSYQDEKAIQLHSELGKPLRFWATPHGLQAAIWKYDKKYILCFRGSDEAKDWVHDLNVFPGKNRSQGDGRIHSGFFDHVFQGEFWESLIDELNDYQLEKIIVCGHSLGGAAAVISSYYLADHFPGTKIIPITFGQPAVGDKKFNEGFKKKGNISRLLRFAHTNDPVVTVSPYPYQHFGDELVLFHPNGSPRFYTDEHRFGCCERGCAVIALYACCRCVCNAGGLLGYGFHLVSRYEIGMKNIQEDDIEKFDSVMREMNSVEI